MKKIFAALVLLSLAHHSVSAQTPKPGERSFLRSKRMFPP